MNRASWVIVAGFAGALALRSAAFGEPDIPADKIPKNLPLNVKSGIQDLYWMDPVTRALAATKLGRLGETAAPAIPFLVGSLHDDLALRWVATLNEDPFERSAVRMGHEEKTSPGREAAKALMKIGDLTKEPLLEALAKDNRLETIRNAAYALGGLKETRAAPLIIPLLDPHRLVARCKMPSIAALTDDERLTLTTEVAKKLYDEMATACTGDLADLLKAALDKKLKDEDGTAVVPERVKALREGLLAQAKDDLVKKLRGDLVAAQAEIARTLGRLRATEAVEALIAALGDPHRKPSPGDVGWQVRRDAATSLGIVGNTSAVEPLVARLDDRPEVRAEAEKALMDLRDPSVVPLAIEKLKSDDPVIRRIAVRLLSKFPERRTIPALIEHVKDPAPDVQFEALSVLQRISNHHDFPPLPALWQRWWETELAADKLNVPTAGLADACLAALKDEDWALRVVAARRLGATGDRRAVAPLIEALTDKDPWVRKGAAQSLGVLADPRAVEALIAALKDTDTGVQFEAQTALRTFSEQDFGRDPAAWSTWWQQNRENVLARVKQQEAAAAKVDQPTATQPHSAGPPGSQPSRGRLGLLLLLALLAVGPIALIIVIRFAQKRW